MNGHRLFLDNLSTIDRVVATVARRHRLTSHQHDEFRSLVRLRLLEDDARVLRAFERRSSMATFLTIVISRIFLDFRNQEWGRWRPSAQARRLGPVAILLDRLMTRDGYQIEEAIEVLRTNHKVAMSDTEIRALWDTLPRRQQTMLVGEEAAEEVSAPDEPSAETEFSSEAGVSRRLAEALVRAISKLESRDRTIVQLHFKQGVSAQTLAEHFGVSKATFHRRVNKILADVRASLVAEDLQPSEILELIRSGRLDFPDIL
jgi:RNA polymerase sigma factor for flagellar operon FliA